MKSLFRHPQGFTAIETLVAIFILTLVGLLIGKLLIKTSILTTRTHGARGAAALAQLVFEQYEAYSDRGLGNLASYDIVNATPRAFLGSKDNLGYDDLRITTVTKKDASGDDFVTATISWGTGAQAGALIFEKTFIQTAGHRAVSEMSGL